MWRNENIEWHLTGIGVTIENSGITLAMLHIHVAESPCKIGLSQYSMYTLCMYTDSGHMGKDY
jgi:hypothetical protein